MSEVQNTDKEASSNSRTRNGLGNLKEILFIIGALMGFVTIIVSATIYVVSNITSQKKDIEHLNIEMANYKDIQKTIEELSDLVSEDHEMFLEVASVSTEEETYNIVFKDAYQVETVIEKNEEFLAAPVWEKGSVIAIDAIGDITYRDEDLYNLPIISSYLDGDNEIYFYGRFNENNHWNGKCILNVYNENNLVSIFEGVYDDGVLYSYKRVSSEEKNVWLVNERIREENYNKGETWTYEKEDEFTKGFSLDNVKEKQILTVDKFLDSKDLRLLSYYKGNTSKGLYNDDSGRSYLVKYKEDGNVDYLYVGKMKDGYPHDDTGSAWSIGWGYDGNGYYYYEGKYNNGKRVKTPKNWEPMTEDEIKDTVDPSNFKCLLTGLVENEL